MAVPDIPGLAVTAAVPLVGGPSADEEDATLEVTERGTAFPLLALTFFMEFSEESKGRTACRFREPFRCWAAKQTSQ